jgi:hypothetical protein
LAYRDEVVGDNVRFVRLHWLNRGTDLI